MGHSRRNHLPLCIHGQRLPFGGLQLRRPGILITSKLLVIAPKPVAQADRERRLGARGGEVVTVKDEELIAASPQQLRGAHVRKLIVPGLDKASFARGHQVLLSLQRPLRRLLFPDQLAPIPSPTAPRHTLAARCCCLLLLVQRRQPITLTHVAPRVLKRVGMCLRCANAHEHVARRSRRASADEPAVAGRNGALCARTCLTARQGG